jgi:hypothetical protein
MSRPPKTKPVEDTVAMVNNELAVGADLKFQRRWWRFERVIWVLFTLLVILDLAGAFGRGYLANGHARTSDGSLDVHYERIQRFSTPSILRVEFGPGAIDKDKVRLWVSDSLVKALGTQRVIPQPSDSVLGNGGILYTFPATRTPLSVEFALEPASLGATNLVLKVPGRDELKTKIFVMP